ncbi:MAG TPA: D-2-hydroxyacid dehydrogenase [Bryobacteraceae bacterium]|nr:D-2-hydroxyacid dehydrogenase [Bryobacteraceae bacterium]
MCYIRSYMEHHTVLVLADPTEPQLAMLEALPDGTGIAVGNRTDAFVRAAEDATVILQWSGSRELLRDTLAMVPGVRWVHVRSAGLDGVLFPELIESRAVLTNGRGVFSAPLGEFAIGAALFFAKDFRRMVRNQEAGAWEQFDVGELAGSTVGILGYGDIGRAVASRARAFGMRILALRRRPKISSGDPLVDVSLGPADLPELLAQSDYLVAAAPLTPETRGMIGDAAFGLMKPGAVLINIGRGPVVDEAALVRALRARRIRGAALDVFENEPLPAGHPLYSLDNVLLSPHCADHTTDWLERAMGFFLENFKRFREARPLLNIVDKRQGY